MPPRLEPAFFDRTQAVDGDGNYSTAEVPYFVFAVDDEDMAIAFANGSIPGELNDMELESIEIDERLSADAFKIVAKYKVQNSEVAFTSTGEPDSIYSFDTGGGTRHLTQSFETVSKSPSNAPDYGGAIGYDGENVNGIDVTIPVMNFTETHYLRKSKVSTSYKKMISELTGKVNSSNFKGYAPGEVLFLGASGSRRGDSRSDYWEITFKFAVSPNRTSIPVGGVNISSKKGWDYLWVRYADDVGNDNALIKKPVAAYVEKVYESADFGALGIGR